MHAIRPLVALLLLAAAGPGVASAQGNPADLDPTFGSAGVSMSTKVSNRSEWGHEVVRAPDGGYYASGSAAPIYPSFIARHRSDGARDANWGNAGVLTYPGDVSGRQWQLAVDGQGRLVAGADLYFCPDGPMSCFPRSAVVRITPQGTFDESFSGDGRLLLPEGEVLEDVAVDGSGRILIGVKPAGSASRVVRLLASGTADDAFTATELSHPAQRIVPHGDGVVVGSGWPGDSPAGGYVLTRLDAAGAIDTGFGDPGGPPGRAQHAVAASEGGFGDLLALPGGRLIVGWGRLTLHAYRPDGTPDTGFGQAGVATVDTGGAAKRLALDAGGRIVTTVNEVMPAGAATMHFLLARFTPEGALDTGFGTGGTAFGSFDPAFDSYAGDVLVDPAGRIVVLGASGGDDHVHAVIALARFRGGDTPQPDPDPDPDPDPEPDPDQAAPPVVVPPPAIDPPSPVAPALDILTPRRSKVRSRQFAVHAGYGAPAIVRASAVVRSGKRRWAIRPVNGAVDAGAPAVLRLRLPAAAVRAIRSRRTVSARVTVRVVAGGRIVATRSYSTRLRQ